MVNSGSSRAISLIELLACVTIVAIVFGMVVPGMNRLVERNHATATVNWLLGAIHFARYSAITRRVTVTLCPFADGKVCHGHWHDGLVVFTDRNRNATQDGRDEILQMFASPADGSTLRWRSFRNRQYLQMTGDGLTHYQNGNFVYCSRDQDPRYARQIVINVAGRPRMSRDRDGDGIVEDRNGNPLRC